MASAVSSRRKGQGVVWISENCYSQTIAVVKTRVTPLGMDVRVCPESEFDLSNPDSVAVLLQYPNANGTVEDYQALADRAKEAGALTIVATDLLACTLLAPPGEWGA